ncbi:hypothetical protein BC629DRAFT_1591825 [Irpex lacteus]|nr:hypothetical protein BC629DRAFT_1591825 [Irpex lacteus]
MSQSASSQVHTFAPPYTALATAAEIPQELFDNIVYFVRDSLPDILSLGDEDYKRGYYEKVRTIGACALTCVRWANLTRPRMLRKLVLRSPDDLRTLKCLLRASHSPRISRIGQHLETLIVYCSLERYPWFYDIQSLRSKGASRLREVSLYLYGPMPPSIYTQKNTIRHPLFYGAPRTLPISFPPEITIKILQIKNVHLPNELTAFNLLRDLDGLRKDVHTRYCDGITWPISTTRNPRPAPRMIFCGIGKSTSLGIYRCTNALPITPHLLGPAHTFPQSRVPPTCLSIADTLRINEIVWTTGNFDFERNRPGLWNLEIGTCADNPSMMTIPGDLFSALSAVYVGYLVYSSDLAGEGKYTYYLEFSASIGTQTYLSDSDWPTIAQVKCVLIEFIDLNADDEPNLLENIWVSDPSNPHWNVWKKILGLIYDFPTLECLAVMAHDEEQLAHYVAWLAEELHPFRANERVGFAWYCFTSDAVRPYKIEIGYEDLLKRAKEIEELEDGGSSDELGSEMSDESEDSVENGDFNIESTSQSKSKGTPEMNMFGDDPNSTNTSDYHRATQLQVDYSISAPSDNDPRCNTCGDRLIAVRREERKWAISCPTCRGY